MGRQELGLRQKSRSTSGSDLTRWCCLRWRRQNRCCIRGTLVEHLLLVVVLIVVRSPMIQVAGTGSFQLQLTSFQNRNSSTYDGTPCIRVLPPISNSSSTAAVDTAASSCRTFLRVCLTNYRQQYEPPEGEATAWQCEYGEQISAAIGASLFNASQDLGWAVSDSATDNVLASVDITFTFTWPGQFTLLLELFNDITTDGIITDDSPRQLIQRDVVSHADQFTPGTSWTMRTQNRQSPLISFAYQYRVVCSANYYGPGCNVFCVQRDDLLGHWGCDSRTGSRTCATGWLGDFCNQAVCRQGCNMDHAKPCSAPDDCTCKKGWQGEVCEQCVLAVNCSSLHGTCSVPGECNCLDGWGGEHCATDLNYCTTHQNSCLNGGTCFNRGQDPGFECACLRGFTGTNCEIALWRCSTADSCLNGGVCNSVTGRCICSARFSGSHCESEQPAGCDVKGCLNGGNCSMIARTCFCPVDFTGPLCEQRLPMSVEGRTWENVTSSSNVTFVNMSASEFNNSSSGGVLPLYDPRPGDVPNLIIIICLGVVLPAAIVSVSAGVWTACRRCGHGTVLALPSGALPLETLDNRLNALHNTKQLVDDGECDVKAPINSCASSVPLTVVNVISDGYIRGRVGGARTSHVMSTHYSRLRPDVTACGGSNLGDCSEENSFVGEASLWSDSKFEVAEGDRNFKNARRAADANKVNDVTMESLNEYHDVTDACVSWCRQEYRGVNVLRGSSEFNTGVITDRLLPSAVVDDWLVKSSVSGSPSAKTS